MEVFKNELVFDLSKKGDYEFVNLMFPFLWVINQIREKEGESRELDKLVERHQQLVADFLELTENRREYFDIHKTTFEEIDKSIGQMDISEDKKFASVRLPNPKNILEKKLKMFISNCSHTLQNGCIIGLQAMQMEVPKSGSISREIFDQIRTKHNDNKYNIISILDESERTIKLLKDIRNSIEHPDGLLTFHSFETFFPENQKPQLQTPYFSFQDTQKGEIHLNLDEFFPQMIEFLHDFLKKILVFSYSVRTNMPPFRFDIQSVKE